MKYASIALALLGFTILTGCDTPTPDILSLHSFATEKDTAMDASLVGTWESGDDSGILCVIRAGSSHKYDIVVFGAEKPFAFSAQLLRVGDVELLDLTPDDKNDFRIPGHSLVRVWPSGMSFRWAFVDSDWARVQAAVLATKSPDGKLVLLSPTEHLRVWAAAIGADERAYGKTVNWQRAQ